MSTKHSFFAHHAVLILVIVFFLVPFAIRGARMALQGMKNDVRDWLPSDFPETAELEWFRQHFLGEQFVVVSWEGCHGDVNDTRFRLFLDKLAPERPPSLARAKTDRPASEDASGRIPQTTNPGETIVESPARSLSRPEFIGDRLGLYTVGDEYLNWGGRQEKWLKGSMPRWDRHGQALPAEKRWFYITPEGDLYHWEGINSLVASAWRSMARHWGTWKLEGEQVGSFGPLDGPWYYRDPRRLRAQLFETALTGPDLLASLTRPNGVLEDDPAEAWRRLTGTLFGPDHRQTCIVLTLTDAARRDLHQVVGRGVLGRPRGRLYEIAQECAIDAEQLRLGGPPVDNVAIDEEGSITLVRLVGFSIVLGLALSMLCFRSVRVTLMVLFVGGISAILSLALVYALGSHVDAIMMSMPSLIYVLGLAGAAHIINYYQQAVTEGGTMGAAEKALARGWKPALLCNVTTAIGLGSLYTSELVPIRNFGLFSAIGVLATLLLLFTFLPAALQVWPPKRRSIPASAGDSPRATHRLLTEFWARIGGFCIRHHALVSLAWLTVIVVVGWGVTRIQTSVNLLELFHNGSKIIRDYAWLEAHLGELVPMEIVLKVNSDAMLPSADSSTREMPQGKDTDGAGGKKADEIIASAEAPLQLSFLERMELASRVQQVIEDELGQEQRGVIGRTISAATFAPVLPKPKGNTLNSVRRGTTSRMLENHRQQFLQSDYLQIDRADRAELWRISLRISATKGLDYGLFLNQLKEVVEPIVAAQLARERILGKIIDQRQGGRPMGANVLLLGLPTNGATTGTLASGQESGSGDAQDQPNIRTKEAGRARQTRIFARTLQELLAISRLRVVAVPDQPRQRPDELAQLVAKQDCVVLVAAAGYQVPFIRQHARALVDVRQHVVDPAQIQPGAFQARDDDSDPSVVAIYTGVVPLVYKAQHTLLGNLIESTFWSFVTIAPLIMFISRSVGAGGVAMLPNVLPVLVVFGAMGWMGIVVDVGSMMTASIALGVAVDDTIHYLNWFRDELDRVGNRQKAILAAYRHCATPTLQAAIIGGLGLSVFALSTFTPTRRFGYLMLSILWMGVAAELLFFPALLAGPLGAVFKPRRRPTPTCVDEVMNLEKNVG